MNTRVQVEHCVTEEVSGIDIVREQILIAAGEDLSITQDDVVLRGHAIECRINAEDAAKNFAPAPGTVTHYREPSGPGVRVDSGVLSGSEITPLYDPMVAKLIVRDTDREGATARMLRALKEFEIEGVTTLIPFHEAIMASRAVGQRRDLPRPDRRPHVAQGARAAQAREARRGRAGARRAHLHRRGVGQALRRHRPRRADARPRQRRRARAGAQAGAQRARQERRRRRQPTS